MKCHSTVMRRSISAVRFGLAASLAVAFGCSDITSARRASDSAGGKHGSALSSSTPLNANKMASLSRYSDGGCGAMVIDPAGVARGFPIRRQNLPFAIPGIQHNSTTGQGNGAVIHFSVSPPGAAPVAFTCWMPNSVSPTDVVSAMKGSKNGRWSALFRMLPKAAPIPDRAHRQPLSDEVQAFAAQTLAPRPAPTTTSSRAQPNLDAGCFDEHGWFDWYNDGTDSWLIVEVDVEVCDDGGGDIFEYLIDNGYSSGPYVTVDADKYNITDGDTVTFTAEVVSDERMPPVGWAWNPGAGYSADPWTGQGLQNCGTSTTCSVSVHASGSMSYSVTDASGNPIAPGGVTIIGVLPPDIEQGFDDNGDAPSSTDSSTGPSSTVELSALESEGVFNAALASGEWLYTQGCAHCSTPFGTDTSQANAEEIVNYSLRRGDCTDLVQYAHQAYLGLTAWPFAKMSTTQYNSWSPAALARHGFAQIDSTQVRVGDVVVRTVAGGSGHAGLFIMWAEGWEPEAWANGGSPAYPTVKRRDGLTGIWTATRKAGYVTKFFRAMKVAP